MFPYFLSQQVMCIKWEFIPTTQFVIVNEVSIIQGVHYSTVQILIDLHVLNMRFVMLFDKTTHTVPYSGAFSGEGGGKFSSFLWLRNKPQNIYPRKLMR